MGIPLIKASTVILLRDLQDKNSEGFEILLLRRHEKSSFMGDNFVYPGGKVDLSDYSPETSFSRGMKPEEAKQVLKGISSPEEAFAYWIAAIRELFEEAGVLLACDKGRNLIDPENPAMQKRFLQYRELLQNHEINISDIASKESIFFALDRLHYYAHWITPEARPQRFDTYFFLARCPAGQEASHDKKETTESLWITPGMALERNFKGNIILSPPTLKTIEDLSRYKNIDEIFHSLKNEDIRPVLPVLTKISDESLIIFPWDEEYEIFRKGEIPAHIDHGRPSRPGDNSTRVVMKENRWLPYCHNK